MKLARVVNCKKEHFDVLIDRTSIWGNPFVIGKDGDRQAVCRKYQRWLPLQEKLMSQLPDLAGKILGCHCKPEQCHGDFLAELVNRSFYICDGCGLTLKRCWINEGALEALDAMIGLDRLKLNCQACSENKNKRFKH